MVKLTEKRSMLVLLMSICLFVLSFSSNLYAEDSFLEKGMTDYKAENYEESIEFFLKAREQQPDSAMPSYYLGLTYKQLGNYSEAITYLSEAAAKKPPAKEACLELAEAYYNLEDFSKAVEWIERAEKENIKTADTSFLKGLILLKEGDGKNAVAAFKKAKDMDKSLMQAADFQIAIAYAGDKRLEEARESFKSVIAIDPATDLASYAREYETAITKRLEGHKTWRVTAGVAYQYDDNVVLKPSAAIPALEITGERDSGIVSTIRIDYNPLLNGSWLLNGQYSAYANTYFKSNTHNLITQNISFMPGYTFKKGAVTLPITYTHAWIHEREYMGYASVKPTLNLLMAAYTVQLSAGYAKRKMLQPPLDADEDRDADICSISAGYVRPMAQDKGLFTVRYELSRELTQGKNWDNTGNKLNIGTLIPLKDKVRLTLSGEAYLQDYKNTHTAFNIKRRDRTYTGTATLLWSIYRNLDANLQYSHTAADSNIAVYDYNRNIYTVGMEYSF